MSEEKTVRFSSEIDQAGYTIVENVLLTDGTLSPGALRTYLLLAHYAREGDECWPGQRRLALQCGCREATLRRYIGELVERGLVTVGRINAMHSTNRYRLRTGADLLTDEKRRSTPTESVGLGRRKSATKEEAVEGQAVEGELPLLTGSRSPGDGSADGVPALSANVNGGIEGKGERLQGSIDRVWAFYVQTMGPRRKQLDRGERAVIREALGVASEAECIAAIRGCSKSAWHMGKENGKKYNSVSQILRGKQGKRTLREQIELMLDYDESNDSVEHSSGEAAEIRAAKNAVRQYGHLEAEPGLGFVRKATETLAAHGIKWRAEMKTLRGENEVHEVIGDYIFSDDEARA